VVVFSLGIYCYIFCNNRSLWGWTPLSLLCFVEIQWLHGYASMDMDISMDIHRKYVDMDMDMDMDGKFHIHGNPGLISTQFTLELCVAATNREKKSLKTPILEFKVIQGHWCWYPQKARQQCLLWCAASLCLSATVLLLDWTTVADRGKIMISKGVPLFDALVQGEFPHPVAPNCLIRNQRL